MRPLSLPPRRACTPISPAPLPEISFTLILTDILPLLTVLQGLYKLGGPGSPYSLESNITLNGNPIAALQSVVRDSVNVMMVVGTDGTSLESFVNEAEEFQVIEGRYALFDGYPVSAITSLPNGSHVLDIVDANATTRASFVNMMLGHAGFQLAGGLNNLSSHTIHVYDAVMAIARAIEVAELSSVPATRANVWQALNTSDYVGLSGSMHKDAQGFRKSGYGRILNLQSGQIVVPWTYEQGVTTTVSPVLFMGSTYKIPDDQMKRLALGQLASHLGVQYDMTIAIQFAIDLVNENVSQWMPAENSLFLISYNDSGLTNQEVVAAIQLQLFGVTGVIGPETSPLALAAQGVLGPYGIPDLSPSATSSQLSDKTLYPTFLRNVQPDSLRTCYHPPFWPLLVLFFQICSHFVTPFLSLLAGMEEQGSFHSSGFLSLCRAACATPTPF